MIFEELLAPDKAGFRPPLTSRACVEHIIYTFNTYPPTLNNKFAKMAFATMSRARTVQVQAKGTKGKTAAKKVT